MWHTSDLKDMCAITELEGRNTSDRAIGVICGAIIDSRLTDELRRALHRDETNYSKKVRGMMFDPDGPLGSFGAKIGVAYLMGYFTEEAHADLMTFKKIRNFFAHYTEANTFQSEKVSALCSNFRIVDRHVSRPSAFVTEGDVTIPINSITTTGNKIYLCMADHEKALQSPRERYVCTAKLFCAAIEIFKESQSREPPLLKKPVL